MLINSKNKWVEELVENKDIIAYLVDKLMILKNNNFSFKNNIEYA